jgi:hypothetical protein
MTMVATTAPLLKYLPAFMYLDPEATWRSGYAAVCKTVYPGSIPGVASRIQPHDRVSSPPRSAVAQE